MNIGLLGISFIHQWVLLLCIVPLALMVAEILRVWWGMGVKVALPVDRLDGGRTRRAAVQGARQTTSPSVDPAQRTSMKVGQAGRTLVLRSLLLGSALCPLLVMLVVIMILAGPSKLAPPTQERVMTNIEFVLDVSGSMSSPLGGGGATRHTASIDAIKYFLDKRQGDAFGLTIFGGEVVKWTPLTRDHKAIASAAPFLDPATMPAPLQSTRVGHALEFSQNTLLNAGKEGVGGQTIGDSRGDKLIVLITDGFSYDLDGGAAERIAGELRQNGIVVHAIHVGEGEPPNQLVEVVTPTGGRLFAATNPGSFTGIFDTIDGMAPIRVVAKQPEPIDHFTPFVYTVFGLLSLHGVCLFGIRMTPW